MSNSKLITGTYKAHSSNYTKGRSGYKITGIAIHHMAGVMTAKQCGAVFQKKGRGASTNYGVGKDGSIGLYVDEANTSWANANWKANCQTVTIETSNSSRGGKWPVSDKTLKTLIKLVADIAKRNKLGKLVKGKNLVWHRMYSATTCPGEYLLSKMDYIVKEANKINYPEPKPKPVTTKTKIVNTSAGVNMRSGIGTKYKVVTAIPNKKKVEIVKEDAGIANGLKWDKVKYSNKTGYVANKYLK